MGLFNPLKFQQLRFFTLMGALFLALNICQDLWASQDAMVTADQAVIYADEQMSAAVGFVKKGKKIKVGDIARNRAQVYPIIVSGKIAYIRVIDVSTEKESVDSQVLVAERFKQTTIDHHKSNYSVSYFNYATQITLNKENDELKDKDAVNWAGISIHGGAQMNEHWDLDLLLNFMNAKAEREVFRVIELGLGGSYRLIDHSRFKLKAFGQLLLIPFATYALADEFRVNGYGFSTGGGINLNYRLGRNFGVEAYGGIFYTSLSGFKASVPYDAIAPSFLGTRLGAGLNYQF